MRRSVLYTGLHQFIMGSLVGVGSVTRRSTSYVGLLWFVMTCVFLILWSDWRHDVWIRFVLGPTILYHGPRFLIKVLGHSIFGKRLLRGDKHILLWYHSIFHFWDILYLLGAAVAQLRLSQVRQDTPGRITSHNSWTSSMVRDDLYALGFILYSTKGQCS